MADNQEVQGENLADGAESPEEATKRKFREALERKNGHASAGGASQNSAKVRGTHAQAGGKRTFRRRAGG
ncbi:DUF5302 domain-containing protein [Nocardia seriolae]|uniref:DUF5302 domain-containing protein n=1 Tax=Nocardia seriolae TaxID=37332 RepID=UPI0008FF2442|nr:DUF5302 domain-containing protein [Nocardia seriolae]PSK26753.1 hypothetical protein C6575_35530 [Nocardia seriolae]QOW30800.1 DUF5302 domain-containing protein [Nocardia seriolae]QUN15272.1 DUF5302 domain-containing protein [Nocardia seriolae]WNJ57724.1 DUF5302 domain-containing protein [Nocardia seriolae]